MSKKHKDSRKDKRLSPMTEEGLCKCGHNRVWSKENGKFCSKCGAKIWGG